MSNVYFKSTYLKLTLVHAVVWEREVVKDDRKLASDLEVCEQAYLMIMERFSHLIPCFGPYVCVYSLSHYSKAITHVQSQLSSDIQNADSR
jgi:hypothetical protein